MLFGVLLLLFFCEIILSWIWLRGINIFVLFMWISSGESATVFICCFFSPTAANINSEILSNLVWVYWFQLTFLTLLILRASREEGIYSEIANCFYLKVLRLVILKNGRWENFKIITSSLSKENFCRTKKR